MEHSPGKRDQREKGNGEALRKDWKFYLGLILLAWSTLAFPIAALVPVLPLSTAAAAAIATGVIVSAEIAFWAGAALLGRPFVNAIKSKVFGLCKRKKLELPRSISRARHYTGVMMLVGSGLFYYIAAACAFLDLPRERMLTAIVVTLITGEAVFIASLFILGPDFWARLKQLFQWPGAIQPS